MEELQVLSVRCPHCSNRLKLRLKPGVTYDYLTCKVCNQRSPFSAFKVVNNTPATPSPVQRSGGETDLLVGGAHKYAAPVSGGETDLCLGGARVNVASPGQFGETDLYLGGAKAHAASVGHPGKTDLYMGDVRSSGEMDENTRMDVRSSRPSCGRLVFMTGNIPVAQLFEGCNVVGRESSTSPATIRLPRQYQRISRGHLVINVKAVGNGYRHEVKLFKSEVNQTMINSTPISGNDILVLNHGDIITLPDVVMRFESK